MSKERTKLARLLRAWRERLQPSELGLPVLVTRRVPGIRREELASLAELSVDYIVRLEQGRARRPSSSAVASLSRALQLDRRESDQLYRAAGLMPPEAPFVSDHVSPAVRRLLEKLSDVPVAVYDATWTLLLANDMWHAVFAGSPLASGKNVAWLAFIEDSSIQILHESSPKRFLRCLSADLLQSSERYPEDAFLRQLIDDLSESSPVFAAMWADSLRVPFEPELKVFTHTLAGRLELDCDLLITGDDDLRVVTYFPAPGSGTDVKLGLLRVDGSPDSAILTRQQGERRQVVP